MKKRSCIVYSPSNFSIFIARITMGFKYSLQVVIYMMDYWINSPIKDGLFPFFVKSEELIVPASSKMVEKGLYQMCLHVPDLLAKGDHIFDWDVLRPRILKDLHDLTIPVRDVIPAGDYWINCPIIREIVQVWERYDDHRPRDDDDTHRQVPHEIFTWDMNVKSLLLDFEHPLNGSNYIFELLARKNHYFYKWVRGE